MQPVDLCSVGLEKLKITVWEFAYKDFLQVHILVTDYIGTALPQSTLR